jgi:hypothetical protein
MSSGKNATVVDKIQQFPITINYRNITNDNDLLIDINVVVVIVDF